MITLYKQGEMTQKVCSNCSLHALCMPVGLNGAEMADLDAVMKQSRRLKKGEYLFRSGEPFASLFAVRTGFPRTSA